MKFYRESVAFDHQTSCIKVFQQQLRPASVNWHFHPEIEVALVLEGQGQVVIGNYIGSFGPGDLFLIGANQPHDFTTQQTENALFLVAQFPANVFTSFPEMAEVNALFENAQKGLQWACLENAVVQQWLLLGQRTSSEKLACFISLCAELTKQRYQELSSDLSAAGIQVHNHERLRIVLEYVKENIRIELTSSGAASKCNMTPQSFSRWFRQIMNVTFSQYVTRNKIELSCQILVNSDLQIEQVCEKVGYKNVSHFTRTFKKLKGCSPAKYRKLYDK